MDGNYTYCGDYFAVYTNIGSLYFTTEISMMLYVGYTPIFFTVD